MSYRNPKIIDDKSGQVLGQAIAQGAANLGQGIMGMEKARRDALALEKKEAKDKADKTVLDNRNEARLRADYNQRRFVYEENLKKTFAGFTPFLTQEHEVANQQQFDISVEGQVYGAGGASFNEKEKDVYSNINGINSLTTDLIAVSSAFDKYVSKGGALDETTFWKSYGMDDGSGNIVPDNGSRTGLLGMSLGGVPDYTAELVRIDKDLKRDDDEYIADKGINIKITDPKGVDTYISQAEFSVMARQMFLEKDGNASVQQIDAQTKAFFVANKITGKTEFNESFVDSKREVTVINNKKREIYQRQLINNKGMEEKRDAIIAKRTAVIMGRIDQPQMLKETLQDLNINEAEFKALKVDTTALNPLTLAQTQRTYLQEKGLELFNKTSQIKEGKGGQLYYDVLQSSVSAADDETIAQVENQYYTNAFASLSDTKNIKADLTTIFEIGGGREIKMGTSRYYPFDMTINDAGVITVTKTGIMAAGGGTGGQGGVGGGINTDKKPYNMKNREDVLNFIYATTPLLPKDARALRDTIISRYATNATN